MLGYIPAEGLESTIRDLRSFGREDFPKNRKYVRAGEDATESMQIIEGSHLGYNYQKDALHEEGLDNRSEADNDEPDFPNSFSVFVPLEGDGTELYHIGYTVGGRSLLSKLTDDDLPKWMPSALTNMLKLADTYEDQPGWPEDM